LPGALLIRPAGARIVRRFLALAPANALSTRAAMALGLSWPRVSLLRDMTPRERDGEEKEALLFESEAYFAGPSELNAGPLVVSR
jgi:hypothetical protein